MASKTNVCSSVEVMLVEKFERRKIRSTGRAFVVGMIIAGGENERSIKPCYINDINCETGGDL